MAPKLPSLASVFEHAIEHDELEDLTLKDIRRRLRDDEDWECTDAEWQGGLKQKVKQKWAALVAEHQEQQDASPPPAKKRKKAATPSESEQAPSEDEDAFDKPKTKYDRAAVKNMQTFLGSTVDMLDGIASAGISALANHAPSDDDDAEDGASTEASSSTVHSSPAPAKKGKKVGRKARKADDEDDDDEAYASSSPDAPPAKAKDKNKSKATASDDKGKKKTTAPAAKGKGKGKAAPAIKSTEFIDESDDSSHEVERSHVGYDDGSEGGSSADVKGKGKAKAKGGTKKRASTGSTEGKKRQRKAPEPKPGDAAKGSEEQEERVQKLKDLLKAAAAGRVFTGATGAERTLSIERRLELLEGGLDSLGLPIKNGKLPSVGKAKAVGEKRLIEREMQELAGTPSTSGLRDGRTIHADSDDDEPRGIAHPSASARKKQVLAERKKFGAFLGDQSSDSD
ncbi:uncharacterized protein JCM10292_007732 [Rhodotorula paludigena]|uniref:uncharacterized protein n=1 Tax=Rhodotorula paludigena TaxID=86838 RepID=UPI0031740907